MGAAGQFTPDTIFHVERMVERNVPQGPPLQ